MRSRRRFNERSDLVLPRAVGQGLIPMILAFTLGGGIAVLLLDGVVAPEIRFVDAPKPEAKPSGDVLPQPRLPPSADAPLEVPAPPPPTPAPTHIPDTAPRPAPEARPSGPNSMGADPIDDALSDGVPPGTQPVPTPKPKPVEAAPSGLSDFAAAEAGAGEIAMSAEREAVHRFISDYYLAGDIPPSEKVLENYAPTAFYFGKPAMTREAILGDKLAYFRRWPTRAYALDEATLVVRHANGNPNLIGVSFEYDYFVKADDRTADGRGFASLVFDVSKTQARIVSEDGSVIAPQAPGRTIASRAVTSESPSQ